MDINKQIVEKCFYILILVLIVINALINNDSIFAMISAICGISYTFFAGKGKPYCYLFGITGSAFYGFISWQNAVWGNLFLYILYYVPMQIAGFIKWNKNLKQDKSSIVKINVSRRELAVILLISLFLIIILSFILSRYADPHPILDSITTVLSVSAMYLTVRRSAEQWLFWLIVNALSLTMWINLALNGTKVWSTVIMWAVYLFLSFYFYYEWKKELKESL